MICKPCQDAADLQSAGKAGATEHPVKCDCDCQHKPIKKGQISER